MHLILHFYLFIYFLSIFFWPFGFIDRTDEEMTGNRLRERGSDRHQGAPGRDLNPGPL